MNALRSTGRTLTPNGYPELIHPPTRVRFAYVEGATFTMGLSESDLASLRAYVPPDDRVERRLEALRRRSGPAHVVTVASFLVSVSTLSGAEVRASSGGRLHGDQQTRATAIAFASELGFRLPSEAELELLARRPGAGAFTNDAAEAFAATGDVPLVDASGIHNLTLGEWAADDWHEDYAGAPSTGEAWMGGDRRGVYRGGLPLGIQDGPVDLVFALAAYRAPAPGPGESMDEAYQCFRLALSA